MKSALSLKLIGGFFMIIDFHTHCFPDTLARHAVSSLEETGGAKAYADGTVGDLLKTAHTANIDISVVQPIAVKPQNTPTINSVACSNNKIGGIISFGSVHPYYSDYKEELKKIKYTYKLKGIKVHPDFMGVNLDDSKMADMLSCAVGLGLIITIHMGVDLSHKNCVRSTPKMLYDILPRLKGGKIVAAHSGGYLYSDQVLKYLVNQPEIYIDTSYSIGYMEESKLRKIYSAMNPEHILFGTDTPWTDRAESVNRINTFGFSEEDKMKIFCKNALKLLEIF